MLLNHPVVFFCYHTLCDPLMPEHRWAALPRPFYDDWSRSRRAAGQALWHWHLHLLDVRPLSANGTQARHAQFFGEEQQRVMQGEPLRLLRESDWEAAYAVCAEYELSRKLLADQIAAAEQLQGPLRFADKRALNVFMRRWAEAHGRLLAGLAGATHTWQIRMVDELARGFFFVGRLMTLPDDLARDQLFIPVSDLEQSGVTVGELRAGRVTENVRRLLWKQSIRARDALGQGQGLISDLPRRQQYALKRWWYGALEILTQIERNDFDVWSMTPELSLFRRVQVHLQAFFGKASGHTT